MTPEDIQKKYGEEALEMLYDDLLDCAVHDLADAILGYKTEQEISEWIKELKADMEEECDD
jgi:hypothetical protein